MSLPPDTKLCPLCAEPIKAAATKCKHCGSMLSGGHRLSRIPGQSSEVLGALLLMIPFFASLLVWFWVGGMNLLQSPGSTLNLIVVLVFATTATLSAYEASVIGIGGPSDVTANGKRKSGPLTWFFFICLVWIVGYPAYMYNRSKYGQRNLIVGAVVVAIVFVAVSALMGLAVETRLSELRDRF